MYIGSADKKLYALDAATGAKKWEFAAEGSVDSSPMVVNGVVYVESEGKKVYALDAITGASEWVFQTGGLISTSPCMVTASGNVYHSGVSGVQ